MADIEKITANGTTYDIADATAREDIEDLKNDVSELNTKLTDISTESSGSITANSSYLNMDYGEWKKVGHVVSFRINGNINYSAIGNSNSLTIIASGLPGIFCTSVVMIQVMNSSSAGIVCRLNTSGEVAINNSSSSLTTTNYTYISGTYLTAD